MFTAENEDVLTQFQSLCEQYPRENVVALWEMAGGKFEAAQLHLNQIDNIRAVIEIVERCQAALDELSLLINDDNDVESR